MGNRIPEATRCTAIRSHGAFCDAESLPDAPFPICVKHAAKIMRYLNSMMPTDVEDRIILAARDFEWNRRAPRESTTDGIPVVYYLLVGQFLKIGYTADLRQRMNAYPPDSKLLAVEPGSTDLERQRHRQFRRHLRAGNEWFEPAAELMAHCRHVSEQHELRQFLPPKRKPTKAVDIHGRRIA